MPLNKSALDGEDVAVAAACVRAIAVGHATGPPPPARAALQLPQRLGSTSREENTQRRVRRSRSEAEGPCPCALLIAVLSRRGTALACCCQAATPNGLTALHD
jgi:hypothetical protein